MFKKYMTVVWRSYFSKHERSRTHFTYVNLGGLIIGIAAFLIIAHLVRYELSYDRFYPRAADIYRVAIEKKEQGQTTLRNAKSYPGVGGILKAEIPEIENYTRVLAEECMLHYREKEIKFNRQKTFWADGSFPDVFSLSFVKKGNVEKLYEPYTAIISKSAALRFFGDNWDGTNTPIGKTIWLNGGLAFVVIGVFEDLPANSHMKVDFIVSFSTLVSLIGPKFDTGMPPSGNFNYTYVLIRPDARHEEVEALAQKVLNQKIPETASADVKYNFIFQNVTSIHLDSHLVDELKPGGNKIFVIAMALGAALILIVAWINFINLATARAMDRAKEVGVRKAVGSSKGQLMTQFIIEALFSTFIATFVAVSLVFILSGHIENFAGIKINIFTWHREEILAWLAFVFLLIVGGIVSSIYPALVLSSFKPVDVLKGKVSTLRSKGVFRRVLISLQFFLAVFLLSCTGAIYFQVKYMRNQSLGLDMHQVLVLHTPRSMIGNKERIKTFESFRGQLKSYTAIQSVGSSGCLPGEEFLYHREGVHQAGKEDEKNISFDLASIDEEYLPTLGFNLVAGRNFVALGDESNKIILNEVAIRMLGLTPSEAIGKFIQAGNAKEYQVVGVVGDAHYEGLQHPIRPLMLIYGHDYEFGFFSVKVNDANVSEAIATVKEHWDEFYPNDPFDYFFLDSFFDQQYKSDQNFGKVFGLFSLLAVFIACLGLLGLISFTVSQKGKEIGIRKVLGASIGDIIGSLTKDFFTPILVACIVAVPVTHYIILFWLDTFAYRFDIQWWMYLVPLIVIHIIAAAAIGWQSFKAALMNPVTALKEE